MNKFVNTIATGIAAVCFLPLITGAAARAGVVDNNKDICWQFSLLDGSNPYPTDYILVYNAVQSYCTTVKRKKVCNNNAVLDTPLAGYWQQSVNNNPVRVPLVGTIQATADPSSNLIQLDFHGSIANLGLNSPFTFPCSVRGLIDPANLSSPTSTGAPDFPTGYPGYVFAYCSGYFEAVDGFTPFTTPLFLKQVPCAQVLTNPT